MPESESNTDLGDIQEDKDGRGSNEQSHREDGGIDVDVLHHAVRGDKQNCECDGGHVDCSRHGLGVVETFDLHSSCGKCQEQRENLQGWELLVARSAVSSLTPHNLKIVR